MTSKCTCVSTLAVLMIVCGVGPLGAQTIYVSAGGNLQQALNAAQPGDTIYLQEGAEFVGNFVLPVKSGVGWITVRSSAPDTVLPAAGVRVRPADAPHLARLRSPNSSAALRTAAGTHHWVLRYLEFGANQNGLGDILQLGDGSSAQTSLDMVPHHITLQHVFVHGDPLLGQKRGIALNASDVTIRDSHISDCKGVGQDTQAIAGWNGPGPYTIENNYLEGAGENIMFGGADPAIANLVADGITFRRNYVSRPMAWRDPIIMTPQGVTAAGESGGALAAGVYAYRIVARRPIGSGNIGRSTASTEAAVTVGDGSAIRVRWNPVPDATEYLVYGRTSGAQTMYWTVQATEFVDTGSAGTSGAVPTSLGTVWTVKNLFELKNARNVLVEENIFENHWKEAQPGYAIVFTPRNSNGACTWCVVEHVRFEWNVVRNVAAGINLLGYDSATRPTRQTNDIAFRQNVFTDVSTSLGGNAWFMQIGDEPRDLFVEHNTIDANGGSLIYVYGGTSTDPREVYGFQMIANAARHGSYGMNGAYFSYGNAILTNYYPDNVFLANYLAGASLSRYPAGTLASGTFPSQFVDAAGGDFTVVGGSILENAAPDGSDVGADYPALAARLDGVTAGVPSGNPPPPPPPPTPPTAAVTVTCTYLDCAFADASTPGSGTITTRSWTFGDGTTSTATSGTHTYATAGTYTVTLTVTDSNGLSDTESTSITVAASPTPPTAAFTFNCTSLDCAFADTSTPGSGTITGRSWTFGDGSTSTAASGTHTYATAGTYTVTLSVTDSNGLSDTESRSVTVTAPTANAAPVAAFTSSCSDLTCAFVDRSIDSDGSVVSWAWTFGSAGTATAPSPSFTFPSPGTYSVSLTVTDDDGAPGSATASVDVRAAIHAALVAAGTEAGGGRTPSWWKASVTAAVHGADERPIAGATISASWSGGLTRAVSCVTDTTGRCTFKTSPLTMDKTSVTFSVTSVSAPLSVYTASANHSTVAGATGASITIVRP
ncbi:MAG TPA: PKD domain-containing protein [Vicinamibacterales bacterium]|nr:PKD domain-containing protein [Vicinamibacterales bacterium]